MKLNFCTLFDSNYLTRGLALHESLVSHCSDFHLYIFAFDSITARVLTQLKLPYVTVITLAEFEDEELLKIKSTRTNAEYCWTCTPSIIRYAIKTFSLDNCTYVDADLYFYGNPKALIDEMNEDSVLLTEHRYTPEYDQTAVSGKYCVQFMTFKNDERAMTALNWWRAECIKWCYARHENGKFGDQKYLDDWTTRFKGVHVLQHLGGGVAPWNLQQYAFKKEGEKIVLKKNTDSKYVELIFFHFHGLRFYANEVVRLTNHYYISAQSMRKIFSPYIRKLISLTKQVKKEDDTFDPNGAVERYSEKPYVWRFRRSYTWKDRFHIYKKSILTFNFQNIIEAHKEMIEHGYFYNLTSFK